MTMAARATDARKHYGMSDATVCALDGVSVAFESGKFSTIMGPSGSGKSTLLHCLSGLDSLDSGSVHVGETDLSTLSDRELTELRRTEIGFVFQGFNLLPTLSARENIELPAAWPIFWASGTACTTGRRSSPAASNSGWPWPGR
jgi:putative ABC transport system ATP-binding protein